MARRTKREGAEQGEPGIPQVYEGPAILSELLSRAGSPLGTGDVASRFQEAQAAGTSRADVIPTLFPHEPHFGSPDEARRLYSNLFGLWSRVAGGLSISEDQPEPEPASVEPLALPGAAMPLPERGSAAGDELTTELVEAVWKHLDALPERDERRLRHRFESAQPDLVAWLDATPLSEASAIAAQDLVFETWAMFDVAFGDRLKAVPFSQVRALGDEPPPLESSQPALAEYVAEVLDLLCEEDASVTAADRAQVERVVSTVAAGLAGALEEE